jgi:hypothetical protein
MEWLAAMVAGGAVIVGARFLRDRVRSRSDAADELSGVRTLADEDVTLLGEELSRLDGSVSRLDQEGRLDYQKALDAYESAQRSVPRIQSPDQVSTVTDTLSTGRYALACVTARLDGRPIPELRRPCFFNPQHGPSARNVLYTPAGRGSRTVPACAQDAARIAAGERPDVRTVKIGGRSVPYWEAGAAFLPYGQGYFVGGAAATAGGAAALGWAFDPVTVADLGGGHGYIHGSHDGGFDGGGVDGGFDGGGYDGGGGGGDG